MPLDVAIVMQICQANLLIPWCAKVKLFYANWPNPSSRAMAPGVDSASNRNEYQESSWGKGQLAREADNLTATCESTV
jgi:hypothetical protein